MSHTHTAAQLFTLEPGVKAYMFERCACGAIKYRSDDVGEHDGAEVPKDWDAPLSEGAEWLACDHTWGAVYHEYDERIKLSMMLEDCTKCRSTRPADMNVI